ncbi:MAG TPA: MBOAT family O-acyltransferase [Candidatus Cryosericum sp.]|nr:MBOAT family O-acyltransferase [Candidatus Cryosericum sp.]
MAFSTNLFLFLFLPVVIFCYYLLQEKFRNLFLLLASFAFFVWGSHEAAAVLLVSIAVNYVGGLLIALATKRSVWLKKTALALFILLNLGMLFYYKYAGFAVSVWNRLFSAGFDIKQAALPLGISFFTFQGISYLVDLYRNPALLQKNPLRVALYLALFPKLLAGPIVQYHQFAGQFEGRRYDTELFWSGAKKFVYGLAKKMILANQLALVADKIFGEPSAHLSAGTAWVGALFYTLQIYYDFSGYSDMAIGLGRMLGFDFAENFNFPYISSSIKEFWRRWHISLSSWFRDYLYIPLGGNRRGNTYVNLMIVFLATGLWHGAAWHFIGWGLWYGVFLILERVLGKHFPQAKVPFPLKWLYAMLVVVIGWVLFRSPSTHFALGYLGTMFGFGTSTASAYPIDMYITPLAIFVFALGVLFSMPVRSFLKAKLRPERRPLLTSVLEGCLVLALLAASIMLVEGSAYSSFIYFQF